MKRILAATIAWGLVWHGPALRADDTWKGGPDGLWSSGGNWVDGTAPTTDGGGVITYNHLGLGSNSVVDLDWTVSALRYTNVNASFAHTTVVSAARSLVISNGDLRAGYSISNTLVTITGGTIQIGTPVSPADILVGVNSNALLRSGTVVRVASSLNLENLRTLAVGKVLNIGGSGAVLDLADSTIRSGDSINVLKAAELNVGGGRQRSPTGLLRLPPALEAVEVGLLEVGAGTGANRGAGTIDFGSGSQLRRLVVTNDFMLGRNAMATLIGWPEGVTVTVGRAEAPVLMTIGSTEGGTGCGGTLALTNGSLTAYLIELRVGSSDGFSGATVGLLDLARTSVQIGSVPNTVTVGELNVGGGPGRNPNGTLRLPTNLTAITAGTLRMGGGNSGQGGYGTIDFGEGSALRSLTISNAFLFGTDGAATLLNFPAGVDVTVGAPGSPAMMVVGRTEGMKNITSSLVMTGGTFSGCLAGLEVGLNPLALTALNVKGILDLRQATLGVLDIAGDVRIGSSDVSDNTDTEGAVCLPAGTVAGVTNVSVGDAAPDSYGLLELNGTTFHVSGRLEIGATGSITNIVDGAGSGIVFGNTATSDFAIAAGGRLAVRFVADPPAGAGTWGLKMKGDVRPFLVALTNDASRFTLDASGLSAGVREKLGVYHQPGGDFTFLGVPPAPKGTMVVVR